MELTDSQQNQLQEFLDEQDASEDRIRLQPALDGPRGLSQSYHSK
jgi:hypothetical protein